MAVQAKRGFEPNDIRDFSPKAQEVLHTAAEEVYFLINRGYPVKSVTTFVGNRYQLSERQRLALARVVSPEASITARLSKQLAPEDMAGRCIHIDGFNALITLEIAYSESMLFRCMDGTIRDLAGLHGTYRLIPQTDLAIKALIDTLSELKVSGAVIYLDAPVSNSGRLKTRIYDLCGDIPFKLEVNVTEPVDTILKSKPLISSGDAIILDECESWFDLTGTVIARRIGDYPYVEFADGIYSR
ncbi:DUF434 domain-containing protein [uncultured Ruminococcus sp.]|uniref:DUF434 domain-containing protein n=1 Tax=uncultured Ruminococcus sp. TaxID=165186 RepID=UPI0025DA214A|nr:DUF434 domain-containing protein [uncultured Ruminococcus sp.]